MFTALLHNGALLCSQISQVFAVFAPRHVDPSSFSPIHQRLYLTPLLLSLRLTKCCGASTAGRLRVCYITAAPASLNRCRARASLSLATYLASASLFKARQLRFFYACTLRIHGVFALSLFSTHKRVTLGCCHTETVAAGISDTAANSEPLWWGFARLLCEP